MSERQTPYDAEAFAPLSGVRYYLDHLCGVPGVALHKLKAGFKFALRAARLVLVRAGVRLNKPFLVLTCPEGNDDAGLFAEFGSVLRMLEHYDRWKSIYAGVRVDFKGTGLYFEAALGPNWWDYYFEPFDPGHVDEADARKRRDVLAHRAENTLSREKGAALIDRYVRVRPHITAKVEAFAAGNLAGRFVIGVHYRGTDKIKEALRISYETVCAHVREALAGLDAGRVRIFVATDEQAFLDYLLLAFPKGTVCYYDAVRSTDGKRVHDSDENGHRKGEEAIIDCLLLSRCHKLLRTESNLGLCASFFNPAIPQTLLKGAG